MANIGSITAAGLSAKNENTLALANLNFDFSLVKLEAPKEFQQLGNALSPWRRKTAEEGSAHRTARKLGALFEQIAIPGVELVKAYGQRASQISSSSVAQNTEKRWNNIFQEQAGTDGTAIWAAAVSGTPAIGVVLLACMLARMWDTAKATSIWSELVEKRKSQIPILYDGSQPSHIAPLAAARQEITRRELAEWDASARAWLDIADRMKGTEHQKMEDILMKLSLPVDSSSDVFESVTRAWTTAMTTMENLCKGMPQRLNNGAVLVAITAWHLYPDITLFGPQSKTLEQEDGLIPPGAHLTVGLEDANPSSAVGVFWSLSLANLRFYGDPVLATSNANDASRVSFQDLVLIYMGSLFAEWESENFDPLYDQEKGAHFIVALWKALNNMTSDDSTFSKTLALEITSVSNTWLHLLVSAAKYLLSMEGHAQRRARNLVSLGVRRGPTLLRHWDETIPAFFGLLDANTWVRFAPPIFAVDILRNLAVELGLADRFSKLVIRYHQPLVSPSAVEYASVFPVEGGIKRDLEGREQTTRRYVRWISGDTLSPPRSAFCQCLNDCSDGCGCQLSGMLCTWSCHKEPLVDGRPICCNSSQTLIQSRGEECRAIDTDDICPIFYLGEKMCFDWARSTAQGKIGHSAAAQQFDTEPIEEQVPREMDIDTFYGEQIGWEGELFNLNKRHNSQTDRYQFLLGDTSHAAIFFCPDDNYETEEEDESIGSLSLDLKNSISMLRTSHVDVVELLRGALADQLPTGSSSNGPMIYRLPNSFSRSMQALSTAAETYSNLPNATVSLRVLEQNLWTSLWMPKAMHEFTDLVSQLKPVELNLPHAFSCVSMFETGSLLITPDDLTNVLAMSSGNSIIAAASIFADPFDAQTEKGLRGIIGNVGRPGVSMLIPPANLVLAKPSLDSWKLINHERFSGGCNDSFSQTSLHLSFTGYEQPVASGMLHGAQDLVATYLETAVSVFDGSKWVGDVDILGALHGDQISRVPQAPPCSHTGADSYHAWVSIGSWDELFEMPDKKTSVVTAHGNSLSRLTAAAVCIQKYGDGVECFVLPPEISCYRCAVGRVGVKGGVNRLKHGRQVFIC